MLLTGAEVGSAQGVELKVRISVENGRPATQGIRVLLMAPTGSIIAQEYTNDNGEATFRVSQGIYRLRATSADIETAETSTFEIHSREEAHFEYLQVKRLKPDPGVAKSGPPTVSTNQLTIPSEAEEEFKKGTAELDRDDVEAARRHFESAIKIFPQYSGAYNNLGIIAIRQGDTQAAKADFEKAVEADPTVADSAMNLCRLLFREKDYKKIEELLGKVSGAHPDNAEALMLLAQAELLDNQPEAAVSHAQRVHSLPLHERYSAAHIIAGTALQQLHKPEEAVREYKMFLKESPDAPAAAQVRAAVAALTAKNH